MGERGKEWDNVFGRKAGGKGKIRDGHAMRWLRWHESGEVEEVLEEVKTEKEGECELGNVIWKQWETMSYTKRP